MTYEVVVTARDGSQKTLKVDGKDRVWRIGAREMTVDPDSSMDGALSLLIDGRSYEVRRTQIAGETVIEIDGDRFTVDVRDPRSLKGRRGAGASGEGPKKITAPMPGKVVRIIAQAGSEVEAGDGVIVIEAMKMQNELKSPKAGKVTKIAVAEGATVNPGETLAIVE
jgi:biotin carboxyl carrier protein